MKSNLKCVKDYAKCLKPFPKTMYGILHAGMRKEVTARCSTEDSRNTFIKQMLSIEQTKPIYDGVFFKLVNYYDFTTKNISAEMQLPYICCGLQYILKEMYDTVKRGKSEETAKYLDRSSKTMWEDMIDVAYGKYGEIESCQKELKQTKQIYQSQGTTGNNGIIVPLVRFTKTLN